MSTQKLSDSQRQGRVKIPQGLPMAAQPGGPCLSRLDSNIDFPLNDWKFEALGNDLFASTFDSAAADQVVCRAELIVAHAFQIVGEIGDGFLGFGARSR